MSVAASRPPAVAHEGSTGDNDVPGTAEQLRRLVRADDELAQLVAPARPRTLLLLHSEAQRSSFWRFLGPVRLVRHMVVLAIVSLVAFVLTALSPRVSTTSADIFRSSGLSLLVNEVFLLSASVVYRILQRLVDTLESLVQGDGRDIAAARETVLGAQAEEQRMQDGPRLIASLLELREQLVSEAEVTEGAKARLTVIINALASTESLDEVPAPSAGPTGAIAAGNGRTEGS